MNSITLGNHDFLDYCGVMFSESAIYEMRKDDVQDLTRREEGCRITLRNGFIARYAAIQLIIAFGLIMFGLFPVVNAVEMARDGEMVWTFEYYLFILVPAGIWLARDSLRRGYFLDIENGNRGRTRIGFERSAREDEVIAFLERVRAEFDYDVNYMIS